MKTAKLSQAIRLCGTEQPDARMEQRPPEHEYGYRDERSEHRGQPCADRVDKFRARLPQPERPRDERRRIVEHGAGRDRLPGRKRRVGIELAA